jgi:hypothetical protein
LLSWVGGAARASQGKGQVVMVQNCETQEVLSYQ